MTTRGIHQLLHLAACLANLQLARGMPAKLGAKQLDLLLQQGILLKQLVARAGKQVVFAIPFHDVHRFIADGDLQAAPGAVKPA